MQALKWGFKPGPPGSQPAIITTQLHRLWFPFAHNRFNQRTLSTDNKSNLDHSKMKYKSVKVTREVKEQKILEQKLKSVKQEIYIKRHALLQQLLETSFEGNYKNVGTIKD